MVEEEAAELWVSEVRAHRRDHSFPERVPVDLEHAGIVLRDLPPLAVVREEAIVSCDGEPDGGEERGDSVEVLYPVGPEVEAPRRAGTSSTRRAT